ncbi:MAG: PPOX class F420-dependent oxidoreductase [Acidimicrobiales bacterium]
MTASLSTKAKELINRPVLANVATVDEHDHPQLSPVWIDLEDGELVFNTAKGRAKDRNLARNPSVAVSVVDPDDPYNVVVVRGTVEPTEEGADAHIDLLAKKYLGVEKYPMRQPGEVRIKYRVHPQRVVMQPEDGAEG